MASSLLVRCKGTDVQVEAVRSALRARGRLAGFVSQEWFKLPDTDPHPGSVNRRDPKRQTAWFAKQVAQALTIQPEWLDCDDSDLEYELYYYPTYPLDQLRCKHQKPDGTLTTSIGFIDRLRDSLLRHGMINPIMCYGHKTVKTTKSAAENAGVVCHLGNNRIYAARSLGWTTIPAIISFLKGKKVPPEGKKIKPEFLAELGIGDVWITPTDWQIIHPPTSFYDDLSPDAER